MEIARAAAGLFVKRGLRATRAEDIAQAAGIAPRTFYRYFATKEEAVAPLYAAGAHRWADAVAQAPAGLPLPEALAHAVHHTLTPGAGISAASWELVRTLIRLTDHSPALGKVWAEVCHEGEGRLGEVLVARVRGGNGGEAAGAAPGDDAGGAGPEGGLAGADDVGVPGGPGGPGVLGASGGGSVPGGSGGGGAVDVDNVGTGLVGSAELRFVAAVASAAVRTAVEAWAAGRAPATGPEGPAALALRNLEALRDFPWGWLGGRRPGRA
ncbi:TetR family transcriptional regulator [Streptomyces sp. NPDC005648]|uniref:TetR/AcrR family transcriptional regulator n=1 Tax=Streptomyces sp. NPDC005648 TaxID=3157044 RepID=UPI0033B1535B